MFASSEAGERIAFQPESRAEEHVLFRLFSTVEPPGCRFTLDIGEFDSLDEDLAREAAQEDSFAPGTRALVVVAPELPDDQPEDTRQ